MTKLLIPFLSAILFMAACTTTNQKDEIIKAVIAVHDEVMPKMGEMRSTSKSLRSLAGEKLSATDTLGAASLTQAADALDAANQSMMDWMHNFDPNYTGTQEEVIGYFTDEKTKITGVRDEMNQALEKGKSLLAQ
ncbi:MAG: hypothetical protein OEY56_11140 [Cyclobacteriaceae bacterium]|nr:hypothetical protein [Cyclobacteriaceae bacterium]